MSKNGIDVSVWQGEINFNEVKNSGIDFVIIRAGYGNGYKDEYFEKNYIKAKSEGLHVGAYWYSYANSATEAIEEAKRCKEVLYGKQFDYPIYFDLEEEFQLNQGMDFCDSLIKAFCNEMEKDRYFVGFYTSLSVVNSIISSEIKNRYALWIAQWNNYCEYDGDYGIWQYSSNGKVKGISGQVDMDYSYVDYPEIIKSGGFNGYDIDYDFPIENSKSIDEIANEVIKGYWGNGEERKEKLEQAGYDYDTIQSRVNDILYEKSIDELAIEVIRGDWGNGEERKDRLINAGYDYYEIQKKVNEIIK